LRVVRLERGELKEQPTEPRARLRVHGSRRHAANDRLPERLRDNGGDLRVEVACNPGRHRERLELEEACHENHRLLRGLREPHVRQQEVATEDDVVRQDADIAHDGPERHERDERDERHALRGIWQRVGCSTSASKRDANLTAPDGPGATDVLAELVEAGAAVRLSVYGAGAGRTRPLRASHPL